jgi:hypothetical protein
MSHEGSPYTEFFEDMVKWLKAQPVVYRWTNEAGWATTSYEDEGGKPQTYDPF